jgi:hypothetical protein
LLPGIALREGYRQAGETGVLTASGVKITKRRLGALSLVGSFNFETPSIVLHQSNIEIKR